GPGWQHVQVQRDTTRPGHVRAAGFARLAGRTTRRPARAHHHQRPRNHRPHGGDGRGGHAPFREGPWLHGRWVHWHGPLVTSQRKTFGRRAAERVEVAHKLNELPRTEEALARGEIGYQHTVTMARTAEHLGTT